MLDGRAPTISDLAELRYNRAVLDEALRLFPPSWVITREPLADDVVGGYRVARGDQLLISSYAVHHAPEIWPDPDEFRPERFLADGVASAVLLLSVGRRCASASATSTR